MASSQILLSMQQEATKKMDNLFTSSLKFNMVFLRGLVEG